jgi:hypothetical protein
LEVRKNIMDKRLCTDELRDKIWLLKKGAESLYRYGDPGSSKAIINNLSSNDQKRFLYWALIEGDTDIKNIAKYFMDQIYPSFNNSDDLLNNLNQNDRAEIETIISQITNSKMDNEISGDLKQRITKILTEACTKLGFLNEEEAFWILIPCDSSEYDVWIQAKGKTGHISSIISWPDHVCYEPELDEQYKLLNMMRKSLFVIHIHNHPQVPNLIYGASQNDRSFAKYWKHLRNELSPKMKFFIVQQDSAFEYQEEGDNIQWFGNIIESKPTTEKEYYEKQFPLDVAKKMMKEERKKFYENLSEDELP